MGKVIDLTNQKFGYLTVIERDYTNKHEACWVCQCDCGNTKIIAGSSLRSGKTVSCGCYRLKKIAENKKQQIEEEIGKEYGRLTVLYKNEELSKLSKRTYLHCKCQCGNECDVNWSHLKNGNTKSCGCLQKENAKKGASEKNRTNLIGQKFGKLTVIEDSGKRDAKGQIYWRCQCECGGETLVVGPNLKHGNVQSCGCLISKGEFKIRQILQSQNIPFETQKFFEDFKIDQNKKFPRFDFYVNNNYIIEYDGRQHFEQVNIWEDYHKNIERDKIKNKYCFDNNIPIIRIPYWHYDKICLKDLLLETSDFIIKPEEQF